jgi:hypothetical protein
MKPFYKCGVTYHIDTTSFLQQFDWGQACILYNDEDWFLAIMAGGHKEVKSQSYNNN